MTKYKVSKGTVSFRVDGERYIYQEGDVFDVDESVAAGISPLFIAEVAPQTLPPPEPEPEPQPEAEAEETTTTFPPPELEGDIVPLKPPRKRAKKLAV